MTKIFSPYRICPIGAHIDHQSGAVLGRTLALGTTLEYEPLDTNEIVISSDRLGEAKFTIGDLDHDHWTRYAQAAARVLQPQRGMRAHVSGNFIGAGLSSSASVALAYLQALADVNGIQLTPAQLVQKEFELEHDILGLQIGLLDPLTIVHGRRDSLLFMDTVAGAATPIVDPPSRDLAWIVAYSGVSRELTKSKFNVRVAECHKAAASLQPGAWKLGDVPRETFDEKKMSLPENLRRRAEHFFTELERVHAGAQAWRNGDVFTFGQLMNQSCQSSINNYDSGSFILIELQEIVTLVPGVYGSRFSGGGYGGCVVALVKREKAESARTQIAKEFAFMHPELPSKVFIAEMGDGIAPSSAT
jgi:galactokinase/galacturonokinase